MLKKSKNTLLKYLFIGLFAIFIFSSYSSGFDDDRTGSPLAIATGGGTTCAVCHYGGTGGGSIALTGAPSSYTNGTTYTMNLKITDSDMQRAGFQIAAVNVAGTDYVGSFIEAPVAIRETAFFTGLTHGFTQTPVAGVTSWTIQWKAPISGNTPVKFYYVGNAATNSGTPDGDFIYTGSSSSSTPLPIKLARFEAKTINTVPTLNWTTESEINTSHFVIEKKGKSGDFTEIAQQKAQGSGITAQSYIFEDKTNAIQSKIAYYRLKIVDNDGKMEYSPIRSVRTDVKNDIAIYPTLLASGNSLFVENIEKNDENAFIFDINGRLVQQNELQEGKNEINISLQKGTYFVKIGDNTRKIVVLD